MLNFTTTITTGLSCWRGWLLIPHLSRAWTDPLAKQPRGLHGREHSAKWHKVLQAAVPGQVPAQRHTNPPTSLHSSHTAGTWLEAATVISTLRDLPFPHTALTEIQHDEMTALLVPDKLSFKRTLCKRNPQMNQPFLSQLLVITSLFDSSALRASLTACEQGPGEYNYEWEHHKENNHKSLQLIPMLHSPGTKHLQTQKIPKLHCQAARTRPSWERRIASCGIWSHQTHLCL